ncbi:uncharacterized protein N0V89_010210 [Didymosphaeria variabile]|uniref:PA14 domain-containing protein n=1 Tax=Didymosphaeria variabile TaxID=1932322 RepID=A0A9W8XEZ6_9PLEO|nr:uncharacterized protein N0V89_010210 [Didymosphaeria variabile]KAJ4348832.1 hypothetical protein N0V89_010210 [Didymosphaeria variabile]
MPQATTTETETATETSTATAIETTTSTITAYAVATTIASNGVQYRKYTHTFNANNGDGGFTSTYFKSRTADFSGALTSLSFSTPNWPSGSSTLTLSDGRSFVSDQAALLLQGFFIAKETGTYTFSSSGNDVDNYGYAWSGDSAYSAWDDTNAGFKSSRTAAAYISGTTSLVMNAGDAVPFTYLWANGGGVGQSKVYIRSPSGQTTTNSAGYFVQACSSEVFV